MKTSPAVFPTVQAVADFLAPLRAQGKTLVTTNGCFDLLHGGHVQYLTEAAALADILVVGVNCDAVIKKLKGNDRPLQPEDARAAIIGSLKVVDAAFIFYEDDPLTFLEILRPTIHVKGGDYSENIIEKPIVEKYGGKIQIVSFLNGFGTTSIINKIKITKGC